MWHNLGKVNVTKGSDVVTGVGTKWVESVRVGDAFQGPDGKLYQVINVASDETLAISPAYEGETATDLSYWIVPIPGFSKTQADRLALIINRLDGDIAKAFEEFLRKDSNLADVKDKKTARDNLGLGTAATRNVGEESGNLMPVGAFGLGRTDYRTGSDVTIGDLNNEKLPAGFYNFTQTSENSPSRTGSLMVIPCRLSGGQVFTAQLAITTKYDSSTEIFFRKFGISTGDVWTDWYQFYHSGNFNPTTKANTTTQIIAGNGLTGGGNLSANRTLTLGTPSTITKTATNSVSPTSHTHELGADVKASLALADGALQKNANLSDVANKATARSNLGLGSAATKNVGENAGNVMEVGAFGLGSVFGLNTYRSLRGDSLNIDEGFEQKTKLTESTSFIRTEAPSVQNGKTIPSFSPGIHISGASLWARLYLSENGIFVIQSGRWGSKKNTEYVHHTGNILKTTGNNDEFPMSQKAVTDAINGVSDRRDKAGIEDLEVGLSLIKNLKPKLYKLNLRSWYRDQEATIEEVTTDPETGEEITSVSADPDVLTKPLSEYDDNDGSLAKDKPYTGFIAQELAHTLKELGLDDLGLVKNYQDEYGGDDRYYIEHEGLLAFIVRAIQEQQEQIEKLQLKVEQLEGKG